MEWNEEIVARLRELWAQGLSTAEIGRQLNVTKNAVVGKAHRLGLEGRPSPIRRSAAKKEKTPAKTEVKPENTVTKAIKEPKAKVAEKPKDQIVHVETPSPQKETVKENDILAGMPKVEIKPRKTKIEFMTPAELPKRRSNSECCWPIGDPGTKDFHFCGAQAIPGKPYCLEHVQIAYVKLRDRKNNVA
ncbi:GcrA family cell cycle regulator [Commensalibacter oyaizuii]|uniref:GcrA family cell cycle regulator n=1 Tax=Commensalibacter oyaizuii TaxID=3043873 RepID=A0ABT6Q1I8_9PROT|nr:GcrA family cell cycle regulator [Commensalibacter sp. TBRC 16381]MDI2090979.1 GcrA family cell cycle regulator [Commensalibacter sp. TBRC 16381]